MAKRLNTSETLKKLWKDESYRLMMKNAKLGHIVSEVTKKKIGLSNTGKKRSLEVRKRISEKNKGRIPSNKGKSKYFEYNYKPYFCDCGCMEICTQGKRFISGHNSKFENPFQGKQHTDEFKNERRINNPGAVKIKELWKNPNWRRENLKKIFEASRRSPNYKEDYLDKQIQLARPNEFEFVGNGKVIIEGKCPDWINVNGKKQIIELFGEYYHKPEEERSRISYFTKYGYETLVVWVYELKNLETLREKLRKFI